VWNGAEFIHVTLRYRAISGNITSHHRARETVKQLKLRPQISFLLGPRCKSGDTKVWSAMQNVYKKQIKDIDELRARNLTDWDKMDQRIIDKAVKQ